MVVDQERLENAGVSLELSEMYKADDLMQTLLYKTSLKIPPPPVALAGQESEAWKIVIDRNKEKPKPKKPKSDSTYNTSLKTSEEIRFEYTWNQLVMLNESDRDEEGDPVELLKEFNRSDSQTPPSDYADYIVVHEPFFETSQDNILKFYRNSKKITRLNDYIKYKQPNPFLYKSKNGR